MTAIGSNLESVEPAEQRIELEAAKARCEAFARDLTAWMRHDEPESVYWIDVKFKPSRRVVLARSPLDLGPMLRHDLFDRVPSCILTSASLAVGSPPSFDFSASRLGLGSEFPTLHLGSPFDFQRQVTLYIAQGLPDPSSEPKAFEQVMISAIPQFVRKTQGKSLVLFTSHQTMGAATRSLEPWFQKEGITLLSQSSGKPRNTLLELFRSDINSVLFGTESFWQGVDVPGEAPSSVIITKLPFDPPTHPLLEARLEEITRRGGNRFRDYQVPEAILKFKQGVGRLVRSRTDHGIIVILDPRVLTKNYGQDFLLSIPACRTVLEKIDLELST
ncbi:MAG: ATP-dependent DNA helicase [Isosphaerales bacterium]